MPAAQSRWIAPLALDAEIEHVLVSPDNRLAYVPFSALLPGRDVAFVSSATTWRMLEKSRGKPGERILAIGDPDTAAPGRSHLPPLPGAREEAKAIGDVLLLGKQATEDAVERALTSSRWRRGR